MLGRLGAGGSECGLAIDYLSISVGAVRIFPDDLGVGVGLRACDARRPWPLELNLCSL